MKRTPIWGLCNCLWRDI